MLPLWRWFTPPAARPPEPARKRRTDWSLRATRHALALAALFVGSVCAAWWLVVAIFYAVLHFAGVQT